MRLKKCSRHLFSMPWRAKRTVAFCANRFVGVPSCLARLCPAASPCAAPPRPACGTSGFWARQTHAMHVRECKPIEEQNPRLTTGLCAVRNRFIRETTAALRSWLLTSVPTPNCLCKHFSCKACPGITETLFCFRQRSAQLRLTKGIDKSICNIEKYP